MKILSWGRTPTLMLIARVKNLAAKKSTTEMTMTLIILTLKIHRRRALRIPMENLEKPKAKVRKFCSWRASGRTIMLRTS